MSSLRKYLILHLLALPTSYALLNISCGHAGKMIYRPIHFSTTVLSAADSGDLDPTIASQFKILTCSATSCAAKRRKVGLDEFATLAGLYERKEGACATEVEVCETSCLGCCRNAPVVAIEHEDFFGTVALEGMTPNEFSDSL